MGRRRRRRSDGQADPNGWLATYADMITLLMCFFVIMFNPDDITQAQLDAISTSIQAGGLGIMAGGLTISFGRNAELGSMIMALPSMDRGRSLGSAIRRAISVFAPEIRSNKIRITNDERGIVITLASDAFFNPASARINIEATRDILLRLGSYLESEELSGRKFRIEGHTDAVDVDPAGPWESNWELSTARSINILHYLTDLGVNENRFQVSGFAHIAPIASNDTPEGRAYNRRVDIIILDDAHL
jgi:chemotaxis protein MotB